MNLRIQKDGRLITNVNEWFKYAPPKMGRRHWVDGRSAKELAKAFFETGIPAVPPELRSLLRSHKGLGKVDLEVAFPEHKIALDRFPGETRNADLAAIGVSETGRVAVTIEAKADESFGRTIGEVLNAAPVASNLPKRIASLAKAVLGHADSSIKDYRYQLLHGIAGSLIFAKEQGAAAAVFAVFEFLSPSCRDSNVKRNDQDFRMFLQALSPNAPVSPTDGELSGPFLVQGGGLVPARFPLYVGKAVRRL